MKNLLQMFALMFPTMWKSFHTSSKILFFIFAVTVITLYTIIVSWAAIKATGLDAANDWWMDNYREAHAVDDKFRNDIISTMGEIKNITQENRDDIKFLNRHLIEKSKNNP